MKKHMESNHLCSPTSANKGVFDASWPNQANNRLMISHPVEDSDDSVSAAPPNEVNHGDPPSYPADDDGDGSIISAADSEDPLLEVANTEANVMAQAEYFRSRSSGCRLASASPARCSRRSAQSSI